MSIIVHIWLCILSLYIYYSYVFSAPGMFLKLLFLFLLQVSCSLKVDYFEIWQDVLRCLCV